jgi:drug/metabolite transporter (DMT)-like permease
MSERISPRPALLLVAATACWGVGTVLSKQVLNRGVAPLTLLVLELTASSLLLLLIVVIKGIRLTWTGNLRKLALLGVLNPGLSYALALLGLASISAGLSVLLWATEPLLILLLAALVLREKFAKSTLLAVTVAVVGVTLILFQPVGVGEAGEIVGISLTMGAVIACAVYTVLTRSLLLDDGSLDVVFVQQIAALIFAMGLVGVVVAFGGSGMGLPGDAGTWVLAAVSGIVYYGLAFWLFIAGLKGTPATFAGSLLPLIPVFGLAASYMVGERFQVLQWLGALIVLIATCIAGVSQLVGGRNLFTSRGD